MRKKSLFVSWGLALCATGALMATGCKTAGINMPGGRLLSWMNKDSSVAKNDPIKPPSQLDIPGPGETEIAAQGRSDTGEQYPTQDRGYSDSYPGAGGNVSVASNQDFGAGPSSWNPDAKQSPAATTDWGGNAKSPGAIDNTYVAGAGGEFQAGGQQQFGPSANDSWNNYAASSEVTDNPYVNQQPGGAPGDFNGGQFAANNTPVETPSYPQTDYPSSYPTGQSGQFPPVEQPPTERYIASDNSFNQSPTQPGAGDFNPQDDFSQPPLAEVNNQSVARADSSFQSAPQPPVGSDSADIIPPPSNLMTANGGYAPGSTSYAGGTVVADQRGEATQTTRYGNEPVGGSFQPGGGSFDPSGSSWR